MNKEQVEDKPNQLLNTLFGDNAMSLDIPSQEPAPPPPAMMNVMGVFDTVLYLGEHRHQHKHISVYLLLESL